MKPHTTKILFATEKQKILVLETKNIEPLSAEIPHTLFLSNSKWDFFLMETPSRNSKDSQLVIIKKTTHVASFPTGTIGYIEVLITTVKQPHYQITDLKSLIHSVFNTYHPETTEANNFWNQGLKQTNNSFEVNHIDLYKNSLINNSICNAQRFQNLAARVFPSLPYCRESLQCLKKLHFQNSDLIEAENVLLCKVLVGNEHCYVTHYHDVGQNSTLFQIRLKPNDKLQTQNYLSSYS